jgi:hypothetical protein
VIGPYVVNKVYDNTTYLLQELDGMELRIEIAGKRIKLFQKNNEDMLLDDSQLNEEKSTDHIEDDSN